MAIDVDELLARRKLKRRLAFWRVAALVLVVGLALAVFGGKGKGVLPHIARVNIDGVIMDEKEREELLGEIAKNDSVKAVIVRINSPGGTVVGSEVIYKGLRKIAEEKPVVAVIDAMGASGGYIAALGADRIYARDNALTGSIGVIFQVPEFSKLMDNIGVSVNEVKTSPLKGGPSPFEPMSDEMRKSIEFMLDDAFDWFKALVQERRNYTPEQLAAVADGRVYSGRQAIGNGLIDELGGEDEAIKWLETEKKVTKKLPVVDADKQEEFPFMAKAMAMVFGDTRLVDRLSLDGVLTLWHP
ncbi:signal peptide peptidase SppA [Iodidimonas sp. SYSU 1G8]|uniref:signal peptide peptidase SppA n=1 Tax=Iodidimonas sp. SYSU 1G8 TaxID=3133967 RepID=UPI0031FF2F18